MPKLMDLAAARAFFPGTHNQVFLDAACVSLMPVQADAALRDLSERLLACPARDATRCCGGGFFSSMPSRFSC